ncbi:MAG TPA: Gfo/Idh/MocA family oxidoreductase [Kineosporiaceae bacterium]
MRWGFLGAGHIATVALAPALHASCRHELRVVAARCERRAAALEPTRTAHSYAELLDDSEVDAVYINLINDLHLEWTLLAAQAGKHVLCEKPLGLSPHEVELIRDAASRHGVVIAEAMGARWHPRMRAFEDAVTRLGPTVHVSAEFLVNRPEDGGYRWDPTRGGGALFDLGGYVLVPALVAAGWRAPDDIHISSAAIRSGVDHELRVMLRWSDGPTTSIAVALRVATPGERLVAVGREGAVAAAEWAFTAGRNDRVALLERTADGSRRRTEFPGVSPYEHMVDAFASAISGEDAWIMPLSESWGVATAVAGIRHAAGLSVNHRAHTPNA